MTYMYKGTMLKLYIILLIIRNKQHGIFKNLSLFLSQTKIKKMMIRNLFIIAI